MIQPLSPSIYSLWMTASTAEGEGPMGQKMKFLIQRKHMCQFGEICVNRFIDLINNELFVFKTP